MRGGLSLRSPLRTLQWCGEGRDATIHGSLWSEVAFWVYEIGRAMRVGMGCY